MPGIVNFNSSYTSLRYGKDRPFGGSSNQPYIDQRDFKAIKRSQVGRTGGPDVILRGGTLLPRRIGNDVSRLTQMFFDFKTIGGPLFIAKENLLSRTSVPRDGSWDGENFKSEPLNNGVYLPTSTLLQAAANPFGVHLNKQGIDPFKGIGKNGGGIFELFGGSDPLGQPTYTELTSPKNDIRTNISNYKSKLVELTNNKLFTSDTILFSYQGGPQSNLGIGKTQIRRYVNSNNWDQDPRFDTEYTSMIYPDIEDLADFNRDKRGSDSIIDFRRAPFNTSTKSLNYRRPEERIEGRVNLGNPGKKKPLRDLDYQKGLGEALDKLTALPLYKGFGPITDPVKNDLVKFRIGIIDNNSPSKKTYIHFRAFLDDLQDSYTAEWNPEKYMGRGEEFYKYQGFTRTVNLAWTIAAQSKDELIPMYQKLNYLASSLTPDYSSIGYMGGNLATLTLGGWFYEQPGIITNLNLSVPQESPWEIAIPSSGGNDTTASGIKTDKNVKELPHIVQVTGFQFIPIHEFVPRVQKNKYDGEDGKISAFGKERYLALSTGAKEGGGNNNYGDALGKKVNGAENYIPAKNVN